MRKFMKEQFGEDYGRVILLGVFLGIAIVLILMIIDIQFGTHIMW